jgi:hypothetical protein
MQCATRGWALVPIVIAIGARAAAVLILQSHTVPHSTFEHGEIATNLLSGRGFAVRFLGADGLTAQQAPVYPWLVAAAYALGGIGTPRALLILELSQALLGGLLVASVLALAREVAPGRPWLATLAALVAAVHPSLVYAATHVQVAALAATLLTATLAAAFRAGRTGCDRDAVLSGLLLGLLALTDPILALVAPGVAWAVVLGRGVRHAARPVACAALVSALVVAPWIIRNACVFGEFVAIKSTFGYAFWQGNCTLSQGTDKVVRPSVERTLARGQAERDWRGWNASLWAARHAAGYLDDIALTAGDYRTLAALSEPARTRQLFSRALGELKADPARYPRLCLRRLRYFLFFDETNPKTRSMLYRASHLVLTFLAAAGLLFARREVRRRLAPTFLTVALITTFHALTISSARFHIPIEPLLGLWAAAGVARGQGPGQIPSTTLAPHAALVRPQPRLLTTSYASASMLSLLSKPRPACPDSWPER